MVSFPLCLLINVFDLIIYKKYLDAVSERKKIDEDYDIVFLLLFAIVCSLVNFIKVPILNLLVTIFVLYIYTFQYLCRWRTKIVTVALYLGIGFIMEPVGFLIFNVVSSGSKEELIRYNLTVIFVELVRAALVEIFCRIKNEKILKMERLPIEIFSILIAILILSIVSCCFIIRIATMFISSDLIILCAAIVLAIIMINYFMFYMVERYASLMNRKHINDMYRQEMKLKEDFYKEIQESYEYVQNTKHDLKNQLISLYDTFEVDGGIIAKGKIKELYCDLKEDDKKIYSSNPVLNSILKNKLAKAKENGITTTIKIQVPMEMNIDCGDLGILYGNLLDNAIEACQKIEKTERYIHIESRFKENILILVIKNNKESVRNEKLKTTKTHSRNHGRGVASVRAVVDKYNGIVTFEDKMDCFIVKAILYGVQALN